MQRRGKRIRGRSKQRPAGRRKPARAYCVARHSRLKWFHASAMPIGRNSGRSDVLLPLCLAGSTTTTRSTPVKAMLRTLSLALTGSLLMTGCGSTVTMDPPTIPVPLLEPMAVSVGVRFPDNFKDFSHEEEILTGEEWTIHLGRSNEVLFTELFGYMFENVTILGPEDDPFTMALDAYIEPSIDAFEFSVPNQTRTDSFAVWIRYRIKVWNNAGDQIANWPIAAYGKSQATALGGSDALQRAAILAMRDAAALMIDKLDRETGVGSTRRQGPAAVNGPPSVSPPAGVSTEADENVQGDRFYDAG